MPIILRLPLSSPKTSQEYEIPLCTPILQKSTTSCTTLHSRWYLIKSICLIPLFNKNRQYPDFLPVPISGAYKLYSFEARLSEIWDPIKRVLAHGLPHTPRLWSVLMDYLCANTIYIEKNSSSSLSNSTKSTESSRVSLGENILPTVFNAVSATSTPKPMASPAIFAASLTKGI